MGRHNDRSIKEVLGAFIHTNKKVSQGYHTVQIEKIWHEQMGKVISGYTEKIKFKDGTLTVYLTSSPLKKELAHGKDKVIHLLNEAIGLTIIKDVDFY